ncbi:MAG: hypothetical protein V1772_11880 [Chloroflexota bacterium]
MGTPQSAPEHVLVDVGRNGRLGILGANWNNKAATGGAIELWLNQL